MADRSDVMHRPARVPLRSRSRKRWLAAAGVAAVWALFIDEAGSVVAGTVLLLFFAAGIAGFVIALRLLGINGDHPWVQRLAARPWRDGRDVFRVALKHLPEVFIVTPGGSLLAPNSVELRMNPGDLDSLTDIMDIALVNSSATEVYDAEIEAHGASRASASPVMVAVASDPSVPAGRYRLRQGRPLSHAQDSYPAPPQPGPMHQDPLYQSPMRQAPVQQRAVLEAPVQAGAFPVMQAHPAWALRPAHAEPGTTATIAAEPVTVAAQSAVPVLRLVTGAQVSQTRTSGARAGRGVQSDLGLPEDPTVSRVHAEFTFGEGWWRITSLGRNGIALNGLPVTGEHVLHDGDSIGWGTHPGALTSRVEIGWDRSAQHSAQR